jgi:hypothetical protein
MKKHFNPDTDLNHGLSVHERYNKKRNWSLAIDVGAHNGYYSSLYCSKFYKVIGFEPNKSLESDHIKLKKLHKNYQYYASGLYDKITEVDYYSVVNNTALSTVKLEYINHVAIDLRLDATKLKNIEHYKIQTRTLDSFNLSPDFIKIDVEGAGLEVLIGAEQTIMQYMPTIQIEKGIERKWMLDHDYVKIDEDTSIDEIISDNLYVHKSKVLHND